MFASRRSGLNFLCDVKLTFEIKSFVLLSFLTEEALSIPKEYILIKLTEIQVKARSTLTVAAGARLLASTPRSSLNVVCDIKLTFVTSNYMREQ